MILTPRKLRLPATISYGDAVYRPAGYRFPNTGEAYIAKDGHVKRRRSSDPITATRVLILRVFDADNDFGGTGK